MFVATRVSPPRELECELVSHILTHIFYTSDTALTGQVAGLKTVLEEVYRSGGWQEWLHRHDISILCLQETKTRRDTLTTGFYPPDKRNPRGVKSGATLDDYDSFWCPNRGTGSQNEGLSQPLTLILSNIAGATLISKCTYAGLNGVATFARKGTVIRADLAPLREDALDCEGRCILTDHGKFVVFNCYVPNSGGGPRIPYKQRWLRALRAAMQRERASGKAVLLVGDMNLQNRFEDGTPEVSTSHSLHFL